ncbi:MAG: MATE family efflux transporter [Cytophagaceae bacterium]|jgi:MATE family multidrug resistance protein|nr:MATE family efflux transporter [Cytophagaceae bacterium]
MKLFKTHSGNSRTPGGVKELFALALPMMISTACDGVMTFTDRLFLARVGSVQMNAALGGGIAMQMMTFLFGGLIGYATALTAQYYGAEQKPTASVAAFQAMLIAVAAYPIIILAKPLTEAYFGYMEIPASQLGYQIEYLNILILGSVFGLLRHTLSCYFTGIGKTKIVMTATLVAMVVNIVLDYVLIFGKFGLPVMGIRGAAFATISGTLVAMMILFAAYFSSRNRVEFHVMKSFRFNWVIMKKLLYYGSPAGLEMFLNFFAFSTMTALFHSEGDTVATAVSVMYNWDLVSFIPLLGIEIAITGLVGRYMGAGRPDYAGNAAGSAIKIGILYSVIVLILFVFVPEWLARVFSPDTPSTVFEASVPIAVSMIRIAAIYVLAEAVMVAVVGTLRGAGDTYFTMIASVASHWLFLPIIYFSLKVLKLSVSISWLLMVIFFMLFCTVLVHRYLKGKWKTMEVIEK